MESSGGLIHLTAARQAIAKAKSVDEVAAIRDKAAAVKMYAKARGMSLEVQNDAVEVKLRAERRAGEILSDMEKAKGTLKHVSRSQPATTIRTLSEMGVTKSDSSRWQAMAAIPERQFEKHIATVKAKKEELSTAGVLTACRNDAIATRKVNPAVLPPGKFRVLYADPPWSYSNSGLAQSAVSAYPTMTTDAIAAMREPHEKADEAAALFLWVTSPILPDGLRVMESWGFDYKASVVWEKDRSPGIGWWVNTKHEFLLIGSKGEMGTPKEKPDSILRYPVGKHSEKPPIARTMIEKMFPGPYIELFARQRVEGWDAWGNEIR